MRKNNKKSFEYLTALGIAFCYGLLSFQLKSITSQLLLLFSFISLISVAVILNKTLKKNK